MTTPADTTPRARFLTAMGAAFDALVQAVAAAQQPPPVPSPEVSADDDRERDLRTRGIVPLKQSIETLPPHLEAKLPRRRRGV